MNRNLVVGLAIALLLHGAAAIALSHAKGARDKENISEVEVDVEEDEPPPPPPPPPPPEPEKVEAEPETEPEAEPEPAPEPEKPAPEPEKPAPEPEKPAPEPEKPAPPPPEPIDFGDISDSTFAGESDWEITNVADNPDGQSGVIVVGAENRTAPETPPPPPPPPPPVVAVRSPQGSGGEGTGGTGTGSGTRAPVFRPAADVSRPPEVADEVRASYPEEARREGIQGAVRLLVLIRKDGSVYRVRVLEDPGYGLGEAARQALERFRFRPALDPDGEAVDYQIYYTYRFVLDS